MKPAHEYPVNLPYGYAAYPYSKAQPHHGVDYGAPFGAPVVVGGVTIGRVGNTGYVLPAPTAANPKAGAHLHVDKNAGSGFVHPGSWWDISGTVTFAGSNGTAGNQVSVLSGGAVFRFLHLSEILVTKGQAIKKEDDLSAADIERIYRLYDLLNQTNKRLDALYQIVHEANLDKQKLWMELHRNNLRDDRQDAA